MEKKCNQHLLFLPTFDKNCQTELSPNDDHHNFRFMNEMNFMNPISSSELFLNQKLTTKL